MPPPPLALLNLNKLLLPTCQSIIHSLHQHNFSLFMRKQNMQQAACSRIVTLCRYSFLCHALSPNYSFGLLGLLHPHNYKTRNKRQTNLQKEKKKKSLAFSLCGRTIIAVFQTVGLLCFSK